MYIYNRGKSLKEQLDGAYWERNMIALRYATGWYYDAENNWEGWSRVLCLDNGKMNFHIPDNFDVGNLPQIEPLWDGHTTKEKWQRIYDMFGIGINK